MGFFFQAEDGIRDRLVTGVQTCALPIFRIEGYNESLIAYIMAISSPTDPISADAYHSGWARNGNILSGTSKYNIPLIFNHNGTNDNVGPLFWAHYSYLALDPRGLTDSYANYWDVVKNHTQIIYQHCIQNPNEYNGYNDKCWGLTEIGRAHV